MHRPIIVLIKDMRQARHRRMHHSGRLCHGCSRGRRMRHLGHWWKKTTQWQLMMVEHRGSGHRCRSLWESPRMHRGVVRVRPRVRISPEE